MISLEGIKDDLTELIFQYDDEIEKYHNMRHREERNNLISEQNSLITCYTIIKKIIEDIKQ